ncbi:hypothetical protein COO60DRAFT_1507980 [Scenedesmus sp. NREL 46B-D3]|nr:hypothetical protein COO60DRAFT_1507980 [Scenedesmus sp. NREL 46B-D3]
MEEQCCDKCGKRGGGGLKLQRCSACKCVYYCGTACRDSDWAACEDDVLPSCEAEEKIWGLYGHPSSPGYQRLLTYAALVDGLEVDSEFDKWPIKQGM